MKRLKLFFACMLMAVFGVGNVWAAEQLAYTLTPAAGSNNSYAGNCDVTISGITWNVTGNSTLTPWRLGGKSLSGVERTVYSKTAMSDAITKVELTVGAASSITVNSLKLVVASNADFSSVIDEVTETFAPNSTITFTPTSPATEWATGAYYKFIFKVTVTGTSNKFVAFSEAKFYKEVATATCETPTFTPAAGTFFGEQEITITTNTAGASIYYTTDGTTPSSSNGTLYDDPFSIDETTTIKAIAIKAGATDSQVAEATYTAGTPVSSFSIDFETNNLAAYINWNFVNIASATSTITAHGGSYYGNTDGKTSASITTKAKYANPGLLTFYTSKESGNVTASSWIAQVSEDGEAWTDVAPFDATTGDKGDWTEREADLSGYADVYVRIAYSGSTAIRAIDDISLANATEVAKPAISGDENFLTSTEVSITCSTGGVTISYTDDNTDPKTSATRKTYSAPFSVTETTKIRAIANLGAAWSAEATSKTFTKITPITVAAAIAAIPDKDDVVNDQYVSGIVCTAGTSVNSGKMTYYISDDGSETNRLQIYKGKNVGNTNFSAATDLVIGDRVVVFGQLKNYNNTPEMNDGNYLVSKADPAVATPVFNPNGGGFMGETDVTITCATAGNAIYYTLDGSAPSKSSTLYEGAIHLNATTTITAVAYVDEEHSMVVAKTFTLTAPMTVAEALAALDSEDPINNAAVAGIISTAPSSNPSSGKLTYYISDDGSTTNQLEVYLGFGLNGASFSAKTDLQVGDEVTVFGNLTIYNNTTKEFASGSRLLAFNRPEVAVSSVSLPSTETVEEGSTVTLTATVLPENATNKAITWSVQSGSTYASVADGVVTGVAAGEAVVRAASTADPTKYAECTVTVTAADPTKHVVTFDATVDTGESPLSKSNISMACSSGVLNNGNEYRLYKNSTTTFECSVGNITKIEFTGVSGNPVSGFGDPEVGTLATEGNDGVWTGNVASVSFVASGAQVRATEIKVTYKEDTRAAAGLNWSTDAIVLTVGETFVAPTLDNPNSIAADEITIASDNTELAVVNDGVVSLVANATGEATITATFAGNDVYKPAIVSYTVTVNAALTPTIYVDKLNVNFGSVAQGASVADKKITVTLTDVATVTATLGGTNPEAFSISPASLTESGDITISFVGSTAAAGSFAATIAISDGAEGAEDKTVNLSLTVTEPVEEDDVTGTWTLVTNTTTLAAGNKVIIAQYVEADGAINTMAAQTSNNRSVIASTVAGTTLTPTIGTKVMTLADAGEGHFYLKTSDGDYLYNASTGSKSYLRTKEESENASWTIEANADGVATITSVENTNRTFMRYNPNTSGSPLFNCYASGQQDIALYMLEEAAPVPAIAEIGGKFIINAKGDTAVFSRGNLQYQQSTGTWRCAPKQYNWQGMDNLQMGNAAYEGWVDLFCWSLGAENNYGATSAYLSTAYQNKEFVDWGGLFSGDWSTLSSAQWDYLLNKRSGADDKWGMAMIGDTLGMILLPNDWTAPAGVTFVPRTNPTSELWDDDDRIDLTNYDHYRVKAENMPANKFTLEEWAQLEAAGAIFLPYAGRRSGGYGNHTNRDDQEQVAEYNYTYYENYLGTYWTSTMSNAAEGKADYVYTLKYKKINEEDDYQWGKAVIWGENGRYGQSVRLVHIIPRQYTVTYTAGEGTGTVPTDDATYLDGEAITLADASGLSKEGYVFAGWKFKGQTYNGTYTVNNVLANEEIVFEAQWELDYTTIRAELYDGKWGTICPKQNILQPIGASFYKLTYMDENGDGTPYRLFFDEIAEGADLEAGKPYLFIAEGAEIKGVKVGAEAEDGHHEYNGFCGYLGAAAWEVPASSIYDPDGTNYYGLTNNTFTLLGADCYVPNERAYVKVTATQPTRTPSAPAYGRRRVVAGNNAPSVATGMDALNASEQPMKMIIDGKLYIIRGEKMYNANGQVVK